MRIALAAAIAAVVLMPAAALAEPAGQYQIDGLNTDQTAYAGTATVERTGDVYKADWNINGSQFAGTGIAYMNFFAVAYMAPNNTKGLFVSTLEGDALVGLSTNLTTGQGGAVVWHHQTVPPVPNIAAAASDNAVGHYLISGTRPDGSTYQGEVVVESVGGTYKVDWNIAGRRSSGMGIGFLNFVAVSYGVAKGVALFVKEGDGRLGVWVNEGSQKMGAERWIRN